MNVVKPATGDFHQYVIDIERDLAKTIGPSIDDIMRIHGPRVANEVLASACALLSARAIAMVNVWTGEPVDKISKRFTEAMKANIQPTIKKIVGQMAKQEKSQ